MPESAIDNTITESETIMIDYPLLIVSLLLSILAQLL